MKTLIPLRKHSILFAIAFCVSMTLCAFNKTNEGLSFEWEIIQKSSCESNDGIIKLSVSEGHAPYKIVVDEYSHVYARYSNTADITNALFYNEADEHLVNDVYYQNEIIIDHLPAGVKIISVTDVYGGEATHMIDIPSSVMQVSISGGQQAKSLEALFDSQHVASDKNLNLQNANFYIELDRLDTLGSYSVKEIYEINKAKSLNELMDLLNDRPELNTYYRNKTAKVFKRHVPYQFLTTKHTLYEQLETDKTYILKIYPDESMTDHTGICMSYTYVFNTNDSLFKAGESNMVFSK